MTDQELADIEARAKAATEGPWEWKDNKYGEKRLYGADGTPVLSVANRSTFTQSIVDVEPWSEADEAFIAHARQDVPSLIAEIRHLRANDRKVQGDALREAADIAEVWAKNQGPAVKEKLEQLAIALRETGFQRGH